MQLSAANLLIASQQVPRGGAQPAVQPAPFASAMKEGGAVEGFAPMEFKAATPAKAQPATAPAPAQAAPSAGYVGATRIGANIDITV